MAVGHAKGEREQTTESKRSVQRHSNFWLGLYGTLWVESMELWSDIATELMNLKPHKHLNFIKGMKALSLPDTVYIVALLSTLKGFPPLALCIKTRKYYQRGLRARSLIESAF
ncbi:MAG: hypothetical protein F6K65_21050 [Moorea sp. SIO3C2]|nr:hypothetical protein [Moorena sp. SIO3C2]